MRGMGNLPSGTVTFLLTDIEGSTRLWELRTAAMDHALQRHNAILEEAFSANGGHVITGRGEGDSVFAVFQSAQQALLGTVEAQIRLRHEPWPEGVALSVRMAMHTGEADLRDGQYQGHAAINRCGRLRALAHGGQVLTSATTRDLVYHHLPAGIGLKSLGEHKLRDIELPEHIFQVVHDGLEEVFPPLTTAPRTSSNLPEQLTSFVGRQHESAELKTLLERSRLVTITGSAGAGKTRMAIKVAGELLGAYEDGVCIVELASLADPDLVPQAVSAALNKRPPPGHSHDSILLETLRDQRRLLLLDNCEHLIEACARLTDTLLKGCPRIRVLATSREALGVPGEVSWRMPSLAPSEAAVLFEDRAALALPGFRLDEKQLVTVESLCKRLDGIPLAIELAAARVKVMPPAEILKRLEHRFRLLTGGSRTAMERHQTLRAAVDWSYALLDADEKLLFRSLSVFTGGFSLDAAAAVTGGEVDEYAVMDSVARLVDKSLVIGEEGSTRYRMLEMLRQYGHERLLESEGVDDLRGRHLDFYLHLAEGAGRAEPDVLLRDLDNFRSALDWSLEANPAKGLRLITALAWLFTHLGSVVEGRTYLEGLLAAVPEPGSVRAWGLYEAGWFAFWPGHNDVGMRYFEETIDLARKLGDRTLLARALQGAGTTTANMTGKEAASRPRLEEALAIFREDGDLEGQAACLQSLGFAAMQRGELDEARDMLTTSLEMRKSMAGDWEKDLLLTALAWVNVQSGEPELARAKIAEALDVARKSGNRPRWAVCLGLLARLAGMEGDLDLTVVYSAAAVAALQDFGMESFGGRIFDPSDWYAAASEKLGAARVAELQTEGRNMGLDEALRQATERLLGKTTTNP